MTWGRVGAALALAAPAAACLNSPPPAELQGLWSAGPAACAADMGVRFNSDAISASFADGQPETLLFDPHYELERRGARLRVRITYAPGPEHGMGGPRATLTLERDGEGWLQAVDHRIEDARTGAVRVILGDDPVARAFRLRRCGPDAWIDGLRGTSEI